MLLDPTMLAAGVAGALVPLILHFVSRARLRTVDWGAIRFLPGAQPRLRHSTRLRQMVLLGMRMLSIAVLGAALSQPITGQPIIRGSPGPAMTAGVNEGATTAVIVMDASASMALEDNGRSRLDLAREAALQVLWTLKSTDEAAVLVAGDTGAAAGSAHSAGVEQAQRQVSQVSITAGAADMAAALNDAAGVLETAQTPNRELYIICGRQATSWSGVDDAFIDRWRQRVARWARPPRCYVVPVGTDQSANLAIVNMEVVDPPVVVDAPVELAVTVHNYSPVARPAVPLRISGAAGAATLLVEPEAQAVAHVFVHFNDLGPHVLRAQIQGPGLTFDKRFDLPVEVMPPLRVLMVSGDERARAAGSESEFVRPALMPLPRGNPAALTVVPLQQFHERDLDRCQVLILANVPELTEGQARAIEQFVYEGGGLWIALGDLCRIDNYQALLWRDGHGILPASLAAAPTADPGAPGLAQIDVAHPLFTFLAGRPDPVPAATVRQYFPCTPRADAVVPARYASGQPFVVDGASGHGRVLLMTTTIDSDWNSLPLTSFYLPFAQSAVRYLARRDGPPQLLAPGQPFEAVVSESIDEKSAEVTLPDHRTVAASSVPYGTRWRLRCPNTQSPGVYRLRYRSGDAQRGMDFVVRTSSAESDVTPLTEARWAQLTQGLGLVRLDPALMPIGAAVEVARNGRPLWLPLLAAFILLGLAELVLARLWSGGGADA